MSAGWCIDTGIGKNQSFNRFTAEDMAIDDFLNIGSCHASIPHSVRIDHHIGAVLALVETSGLIGTNSMLQSAFCQLLFEDPLQLALAGGITAAARMSLRALINADKNMFVEFRHANNVADFDVGARKKAEVKYVRRGQVGGFMLLGAPLGSVGSRPWTGSGLPAP